MTTSRLSVTTELFEVLLDSLRKLYQRIYVMKSKLKLHLQQSYVNYNKLLYQKTFSEINFCLDLVPFKAVFM